VQLQQAMTIQTSYNNNTQKTDTCK